ncbi:MAG: heme-binding protein, partial [Deltaproteobacteria bacterium]
MKRLPTSAAFLVLCALAEPAMAIEKPKYRVVQQLRGIEVREYPPYLVAETEVSGSREEAGNAGFRKLASYIFGKNKGEKKIAMTAPVAQQEGAKIAMTAPVSQQERLDGGASTWVIQFMMPAEYTRDSLPEPLDPAVQFREVPARRVVALRYSGTWSEERYLEKLAELRSAMEKEGLRAGGEPVWARYDPPFMPWFMRTNEILVE